MAANESSAIASMRTLDIAEITYTKFHPGQGYTCSVSDLTGAQLIANPLATGQKNGYVFEFTGCAAGTEGGANAKYQVVAYPLRVHQTGVRAFCSDQSGVIKVDTSGSARRCLEDGGDLR